MVEVTSEKIDGIEEILSKVKEVQRIAVAFEKKHGGIVGWTSNLKDFIRSTENRRNDAVIGAYRRATQKPKEE